LGYFLLGPIRRLLQNPEKFVGPYVKPGMKVLEVGPGMGFFTLPMARMVGETGKVYSVDVQEQMIRALQRRATKAKLAGRIEARICSENSLGVDDLRGQIDFVLAFAVVHEIPDSRRLFREIFEVLKEDRLMLFSEPKGHVSSEEFAQSELTAFAAGFNRVTTLYIPKSHSTILKK